jgi:FkbM family methyltransferase
MFRRRYLAPIRAVLRALPHQTHFPILTGGNRGYQWYLHSFNLGAWGGWFEKELQDCFRQYIPAKTRVYDCGAAVGFFTLLSARLNGDQERVLAVEPAADQLSWLRRNLKVNGLDKLPILEAAISDRDGVASFQESSSRGCGGAIQQSGSVSVKTRSLDSIAEEYGPPDFIKLDVETAEVQALQGATQVLKTQRPVICLSCHGGPLFSECSKILQGLGYQPRLLEGTFEYGTAVWSSR